MLTIDGRQVVVRGQRYDLPALPVKAKVSAWEVPEDYRSSGVFIAVTPQGGVEEVPACASPALIGEIEIDPDHDAVLDAAKKEMRRRINAERDLQEVKPFSYLGKRFDADERSVTRIMGAVQAAQAALAAGAPFSVDWVCADNTIVTLDAQQVIALPEALTQRVYAVHMHARALKADVDAAASLDDLAAIDITAGWPE